MILHYQVFIQGTKESGQAALMRVASAIAARYGLPPADMAQRIAAGRFRVKTNIDRATAEHLADDLESMGARCVVVDESGQMLNRTGAAAPASEPVSAQESAGGEMQSGLAAALSGGGAGPDLSALGDDGGAFALATLDGEEERPPEEQYQEMQSYDQGDFAPPKSEEQELVLAVDTNVARPSTSPPPVMAGGGMGQSAGGGTMAPDLSPGLSGPTMPRKGTLPLPQSEIPGQSARAVTLPQPAGGAPQGKPKVNPGELFEKVRSRLADSSILRLAVGVYVALLIGFLPAHLLASVREGSAYREIDAELLAEQARVTDVEGWEALDEFRSAQIARKASKRTNIAMGSLVIWALAGGGLAFLWFRKIDWNHYKSFR